MKKDSYSVDVIKYWLNRIAHLRLTLCKNVKFMGKNRKFCATIICMTSQLDE